MRSAAARKQPEAAGQYDAAVERRVEYLRSVSLFDEIAADHDALYYFASIMEDRAYEPGVDILTEGSASSEMFILMTGTASVFKKTPEGDAFRVAILKSEAHAFFGEGGLIHDEVKTATITSDTACHCLVLSRKAFQDFGDRHPEWALPFYRRIAASVLTRLRKANDDMMVLYKALVSEIRGH
ncbi:MAG: cyclic nucleotide-binding domain-containing protein [Deltaproteobacteria bacterium]|nr:cyclic nucleotide-binding domain-containing protein [Deltaproteobacteria bacterium]